MTSKICVNVEPLFTDLPYEERLERVHSLGFSAVELWTLNRTFNGSQLTATGKDVPAIAKTLDRLRMEMITLCLNSRDGSNGGALITAEQSDACLRRLAEVMPEVERLRSRHITVLTGHREAGQTYDTQKQQIISNLARLLEATRGHPVVFLLEALNTRVNHPAYFLDSIDEAADIVRRIGSDRLKLLFDVYHVQIMSGDVVSRIERYLDCIGHIHVAGIPGRHEVYTGELHYPNILRAARSAGYGGYVGLEYYPSTNPEESLRRTAEFLDL